MYVDGVYYSSVNDVDWKVSPPKPEMPPDNPDVRHKPLFQGMPTDARVQLCEYDPGHYEPAHSHDRSEVLFVLRGSLRVGDLELSEGSALYVQGGTTYGPLTSDKEGILFLRVDF
jgi:quercetin dioxygenase-like cupin family protein